MGKRRIGPSLLLTALLIVTELLGAPFVSAPITWSPEMRLTYWSLRDGPPSVAQTSDGRVWVLWPSYRTPTDSDYNIWYRVYNFTTGIWSFDDKLFDDKLMNVTGDDMSPFMLQLRNQTMYVFWASKRYLNNYDLFYRISNDNGASWSVNPVQLTTDTKEDTNPSAIQAANGSIWLVWQRPNGAGWREILYKTYNGSLWSEERQLTNDAVNNWNPSIAQMRDGRIWVFWARRIDGYYNEEIVYSIYNGSSWSTQQRLTISTNIDQDPAVVQARDGAIWVVWGSQEDRDPPPPGDLYYKLSYDNGASWDPPLPLASNSSNDKWPSIAQVSDKKMWVVWTSNPDPNGNDDIFYKMSNEILFHDVAVTGITHNTKPVYQGNTIPINVVVGNQGDYFENVTVTCYANSTPIDTKTSTRLPPDQSTTLVFNWDTSSFVPGTYKIRSTVNSVAGENIINTDDNSLLNGTIIIRIMGDANGDGEVNMTDLNLVASAYGTTINSDDWNPQTDFNGDGIVNALDLMLMGRNY
jgi:hypothetical protein